MKASFKRVPAVDKTFAILKLVAQSKEPLGISEITRALDFNKSTVFNIIHTLTDLEILKQTPDNKFDLGIKFFLLSRASRNGSEIISTIHPYLERINQKTNLSVFLGIRSGLYAVIVDKVDAAVDIKISSEIGMRLSLLAGAGGKAMLCQLSDDEIDRILSENVLKQFTRYSSIDKIKYKKMLRKTRREGIAYDKEEYIEGIRALAVPLKIDSGNTQFAIWAVGLKSQIKNDVIGAYAELLKKFAKEIEIRLSNE
ncbi:MAG: IclR family transcriptional regulator [Desulfobacterales bacterium]|jgi:IclR family KDG regulon transcriptional repressor